MKIDDLLNPATIRQAAAGFDPDTWDLARPGHDTDLDRAVSLDDARQALRRAGPLLLATAAERLDKLLDQAPPDTHRDLARRFLTHINEGTTP